MPVQPRPHIYAADMTSPQPINPKSQLASGRLPPVEVMWRGLLARDSNLDGIFVFAVRTTGIFCRPTCPAKKPAAKNVDYFATAEAALERGYRACLRCRPADGDQSAPQLVERLRTVVERAPGGRLTDKELAAIAVDPSTARRQWQRHYGMTFQAYHRARRIGMAARDVRRGGLTAEVQNRSGFSSTSGFRDAFVRVLGTCPTAATPPRCLFSERIETPLGAMLAVADNEGLRLLEFADQPSLKLNLTRLQTRLRANVVPGEHPHLDQTQRQLAEYFRGATLAFDLPLAPVGTDFQLRAWKVLRSIPASETRSYSWMAERLGNPGARRAVGRANGLNMLCIVIPCHRVIRADGTLWGYNGRLWRKKWLLDHERKHALTGADNPLRKKTLL